MSAQPAQNNQVTADSSEGYIDYYGLSSDPFAPDPDFFFVTPLLEKMLRLMHYLAQFSRKIIVLTGPNGAGKTAALDQFVKPLGQDYHLCRIKALKLDTPSQVLREILHQFDVAVDESVDNEQLTTTLSSWLQDVSSDAEKAVVVIDNAHLFKQPVLDMLAELAQNDAGALHLVLCGLPVVHERLSATPSLAHREQLIYHHPLPAFSHKEVQQYVEKRFERTGDQAKIPFSEADYLRIYQQSGGVPAQINESARWVMVNGVNRLLSGKGMPKWMLATGAVFCVSAAVMITAFLWQSEDRVTVAAKSGDDRLTGLSSGRINRIERPVERAPVATEASPLPESIEDEVIGNNRAGPEDNEAPEELIETSVDISLQSPSQLEGPMLTEEENVDSAAEEQREPEAEPAPDPQYILASELESQESSPESAEFTGPGYTDSEQEILAFNAGDYTLQLLGLRTEAGILKLLGQVPADTNLRYFETQLSGAPWFVLIYGNFTSRDEAKAAAAELPAPLRPQSAWIRKLSGIQQILLQRQEN